MRPNAWHEMSTDPPCRERVKTSHTILLFSSYSGVPEDTSLRVNLGHVPRVSDFQMAVQL